MFVRVPPSARPPSSHARRQPPHVRPTAAGSRPSTSEAAHDLRREPDPEGPLGGGLLPAAPGGETGAADGAAVAVRRLPLEAAALDVGDLVGEAEDDRGPLPVERDVASTRA